MNYEPYYKIATKNGWTIDKSTLHHNGPRFTKNSTEIWKIKKGWQCADLIDDHYCNHRPNNSLTTLLESQ